MNHNIPLSCFMLIFFHTKMLASTYVGNGGSVYEAEVRQSVSLAIKALKHVDTEWDPVDLCDCWSDDNSVCKVFDTLNQKQQKTCGQFLIDHKKKLMKALRKATFEVTSEPIKTSQNTGHRPVQAVTLRKENRIVIHDKVFVTLSPAQRIMLLVHESGHLIQVNGKYINDNSQVGPFQGKDGGKELLDAVGASVASISLAERITKPSIISSRLSKAYGNHYFSIAADSMIFSANDPEEQLLREVSELTKISYQYRLNGIGLNIDLSEANQTSSPIDGITVALNMRQFEFGTTYGIRPFPLRADFWGGVHLQVEASAIFGLATSSISDDYQRIEDQASYQGGSIEAKVILPLAYDFWLYFAHGVQMTPFDLERVNVKIDNPIQFSVIGVSYGI